MNEQQAEAEARQAVMLWTTEEPPSAVIDASQALDEYAESVRATERAKYERLVAAGEELKKSIEYYDLVEHDVEILDEYSTMMKPLWREFSAALADIEAQP